MSFEVKIPVVGESITEVTVATLFKSDGEYTNVDEILCELESDKATFELTAPHAGTLKRIRRRQLPVIGAVPVAGHDEQFAQREDEVINAPP